MKILLLLALIMISACSSIDLDTNDVNGTLVDFKNKYTYTDINQILIKNHITELYPNSVVSTRQNIYVSDQQLSADKQKILLDADLIDSIEDNGVIDLWHMRSNAVKSRNSSASTHTPTHTNLPNDPLYLEGKQWNMDQIGMPEIWNNNSANLGDGVIVAIIDTGIADGRYKFPRVPDLEQTCILTGYNFVDDNNDAYDAYSHGTHIGGTVAQSTNNDIGTVGIAPKVCLLPIKVLDDTGNGSNADLAEGIYLATDLGANVINLSLGFMIPSKAVATALDYAVAHNVFVVCAAGNDGKSGLNYPAGNKGCHAISAIAPSKKLAWYSSYGTSPEGEKVFLAAPGGEITDDADHGIVQDTIDINDLSKHEYASYQGTSMAAPHVAGVAALVIANTPGILLEDLERVLIAGATPMEDMDKYGFGILNAAHALNQSPENKSEWLGSLALILFFIMAGKMIYQKTK